MTTVTVCCGSGIHCFFYLGMRIREVKIIWIRDHISGIRCLFFIRDGKVRIRDKHSGSATLVTDIVKIPQHYFFSVYYIEGSGGNCVLMYSNKYSNKLEKPICFREIRVG
jgi:hypothetical protein